MTRLDELSKMTDTELNTELNRIRLERNRSHKMSPEELLEHHSNMKKLIDYFKEQSLIDYFKEQSERVKKENEGKKFRSLMDMEFQRKKKNKKTKAKRKTRGCGCK
jgi:hypothetical protein